MAIQTTWFGVRAQTTAAAMVLGLVLAANAGGGDAERKAIFAKVGPSIVQLKQARSLGSGFVIAVDGDSAFAATNYHVVEGAQKLAIRFPWNDRDAKDTHEADGYIDIAPQFDLAIVHFKLGTKNIASLKLAKRLPKRGDTVYTIASPGGQQNPIMLSVGIVSNVRTGREVANLMKEQFAVDPYVKVLGYALDAKWIQHNAAMSHGGSGCPLVNEKGEVAGISTMCFASGTGPEGSRAENYAISANHLAKMLANAGKKVKPWSSLPPARKF